MPKIGRTPPKVAPDAPTVSLSQKRPREDSSPGTNQANPSTDELLETIRREIRDVMSAEISVSIKSCISNELSEFKEAMTLLRKLDASVQFMSDEYDKMKKEVELCKDNNRLILKENEVLKNTVSDMSVRLNLLEQYTRQQNVEINGVPETKSENLVKTVLQLGKAVSSSLKESEIITAVRVRKLDPQNQNPRAIIVKVHNTTVRDEILASTMSYNKVHPDNKLNTHLMGFGGSKKPIFVSEHLSPANKELHAATRKAARDKGYKYVWVRDGRILIRKADGAPARQVRNLEAVARL